MQFFPGENAVGSRQPITFAKFLAKRGHDVTVLSSDYNLDTGLKEDAVNMHIQDGFLRIIRIPSPKGGRGSNFQRLKSYVLFMLNVKKEGINLSRPDLILGSIQPLFTGMAAMQVAKKKNVPFVLEVRDLWPDALVVKAAVSRGNARPLFWMANRLYTGADRIVSLTPGIKSELVKKGVGPDKVDVFPNGFDPELYRDHENRRDPIREEYGWGRDFVAIYTGSFTQVTAVEVLVRAAGFLKERPDIRFEFFGYGPTREASIALAKEIGVKNVHFNDPVPKIEIPGLLAAADVALMCLFRSPLVHIYFENKFIDYMGAGKPILAAMEGEQAAIIERYDTGRVVPAFDSEGLARLVSEACDDFTAFTEMGKKGQKLVYDNLLLPSILERYAIVLESVAQGRSSSLPAWEPMQ